MRRLSSGGDWRRARFLVDESLGPEVAEVLRSKGLNVRDAWQEGLVGKDDGAVFQRAWRTRRILLTHDSDFLDDRLFPEHRNPGVVVFPGGDGDKRALLRALGYLLSFLGRDPELWQKSKIAIGANGEVTIRQRDEDGHKTVDRYRRSRDGSFEVWWDK